MTAPDPSPEGPRSTHHLDHSWQRLMPLWHTGFGLVGVGVVVAILTRDGGLRSPSVVALVLVIAAAYAGWGRRAVEGRPGAPGRLYLALAWVCFLGAVATSDGGEAWLLLAALFPQTWMILPPRAAVGVTVAVTALVVVLARALSPDGAGSTRWLGMIVPMMLGLSIGPGLLIAWLDTQARSRARLLDELHEARAGLAAAHRREGIAAERERVSRELHDTVAQGFTSIAALADASRSALRRGDVKVVEERLELLEGAARDHLDETRLLVAERSAALVEATLPDALERLVATMSAHSGVAARFVCADERSPARGPDADDPDHDLLVVRTAQEALANVRRHAQANACVVRLTLRMTETELAVTDDGLGFDPSRTRRGFGLDGLSDRARACGARLDIDSRPGAGTTLTLQVPV